MNGPDLLEKALAIAIEAHRGQRDRCGAPYITHPLRVMHRLTSTDQQIVAILHDVVEDTPWTFDDLRREGFPEPILEALDCLTKREREPYEDFVRRSVGNELARAVKLADLEDNMDPRRSPASSQQEIDRHAKYVRAWRFLKGLDSQ